MSYLRKFLVDESGVTGVIVAGSLVVLLGFAVIAIDLSKMMLAKNQLQNAADAAALAGATVYAATGDEQAAIDEAALFASLNTAVEGTRSPVIITEDDISFQEPNRLTVLTHRTQATGDPVQLYFMKVLNPFSNNVGDMTARASAAVFPVNGSDCFKPWCFPDRWDDADNDSLWDAGEFYDPSITGYKVPDDVGTQITLKLRQSRKSPKMSWYYAVSFAPINSGDPVETGAKAYNEWISGCEPYLVKVGDQLQIEPGNMQGPTAHGLDDLAALDPTAEWDPLTGTVINSAYPVSPRIVKCIAFDPTVGLQSDVNGRDYLTVSKLVVVFVEEFNGSEVVGRFVRQATDGEICQECTDGFLFKTTLVE